MTELDFFGHWGYFFIMMGLFYIGAKEATGWLFRFFGEAIWIGLGFALGLTSVWMWGFAFLAVDFYNYRKWKDERKFVDDFWVDVDRLEAEYEKDRQFIRTTKFGLEYDIRETIEC